MRRIALAAVLAAATAVAAPRALAENTAAGGEIAWAADLPAAIEAAKASKKIVMICVNAKHVDGRTDEEPAAKGLREVVYRDAKIVQRSREFSCVLLTPEGTAAEYAPLRALGIEGVITSPQHIFLSSAGDRILLRKAYWSHGKGEPAVKALLEMMDAAVAAAAAPPTAPATEGAAAPAPAEGEARSRWIAEQVEIVRTNASGRVAAAARLVKEDRVGDCFGPLIDLLADPKAEVPLLVCVIRALGRDGLEPAALPIVAHLDHRDEAVRGNAAVSLEYIGSRDDKVVVALSKLAGKEKNEAIANHAWRALGRCGARNAKVGTLLLGEAGSAKSEFASYGPCMGLAYFQEDKKAMRGVEKMLKQIGVPGGRRGGGGDTVKRGLVSWVLACIGDKDSAAFMESEMLPPLENMKAFWVPSLKKFWQDVAAACRGTDGALAAVEMGVGGFVRFARGGEMERYGAETRSLTDDYRKGREAAGFKPKGEGLLDYEGQ